MSLNKNKIIVYFLLFLSRFAFSQEVTQDSTQIEELQEVMVTATRTERQLSSLPLPAQLISKKEIQQINSMRLSDLINEQTGLITIPDFGGGEGIQMQGLDSQYTLIMIDGVPLIGRSAGTLDISRISVGNIKQIEIIKGASSSLYGSEALGGVINIITEDPNAGIQGQVSSRYGSFQTYDTSLSLGYKKEAFAISGFYNRFSSEGYDLNKTDALNTVEPFANHTVNTQITYNFSEQTNLSLSGRYYTQNQDYVASENLKGKSDINEWNTHLKLNHTYNPKWNSYFELYATQYKAEEYLNNIDYSRYSDAYFDQLMMRPEMRALFEPNDKHNAIVGIGWTHERLNRTDFSTNPEFNSPYIYAQYDANPTDKLNLIIGARFDHHSEYNSQFSPKAALRYKLNTKIAVKASVGYGFKAPDFRQLYFDFSNSAVGYTVLGYNAVTTAIPQMEANGEIANIVVPISEFEAHLKAENSIAYNLGVDYKPFSSLKLNLNLFRNTINDLIDTRVVANKTNGQNVFSYYNVNNVFTQGLELNTSWKPNNNLTISGGYQLLYAKDKAAQDNFENGTVYARLTPSSPSFQLNKKDYFGLYNRSRHMANFKVFYVFPKWKLDANLRGTYRSKYGLYDTNGNTYLDAYDEFVDGYSIWDIAFNKTVFKHYKIGFGIDNLFGFTDTQHISNISGRNIYGKLNIQI
ncbi:TonB-dependent siderophore receptor [Mangrovimonas sp. YM274]|uniref:TonB-dependent receptor plug domain-containing protein n=1 Tax=Mangrovimonas sp. YM274 TaxID=3070660 RepID=UPI0027DE4B5B|nr:TonB-dependent receptor [Mangrovimonas sp. YM274]WMI68730.1 TonB-dependent receptor [Mangrovimonas sp. YM274]